MSYSMQHIPHSARILTISVALVVANLIGSATSIVAQTTRRIEVDGTTIYKLPRKVKRYDEIKADAEVVSATPDPDDQGVKILGLKEGRSVVTFSGVYTRIALGGNLREGEIPFNGSVVVVVLPPRPLTRPAIKNYFVEPQDSKRTDVEYFLGPRFARRGEWRAITARLQPFNSSVARVELNLNGTPEITITGGDAGRLTVLLSGEQRLQNSWQKVTRSIEVYVPRRDSNRIPGAVLGAAVNPANSAKPIDPIEALESTYESNKFISDNARSDEEKRSSVAEFKKLEALTKFTLDREQGSASPRPEIVSRLNSLLVKTRERIKSLEKPVADSNTVEDLKLGSFTGTWSLYKSGEMIREGYRIDLTERGNLGPALEVKNSQSQLWCSVSPKGNLLSGYEFSGQDELRIGTELLQLRPRSGFQLDIWKVMKPTDTEYAFTGFYLLRNSP